VVGERETHRERETGLLSSRRPVCFSIILSFSSPSPPNDRPRQVVTRLLSGCPAFFWVAAAVAGRRPAGPASLAVVGFFVGYAALGSVLFPTFLPWT
jgi:hypothetical protein